MSKIILLCLITSLLISACQPKASPDIQATIAAGIAATEQARTTKQQPVASTASPIKTPTPSPSHTPTLLLTPSPTHTPTATATLQPTPLPLALAALAGQAPARLCLAIQQRYPAIAEGHQEEIEPIVRLALEHLGFSVLPAQSDCDADLEIRLNLEALGMEYNRPVTAYCYSGASVNGQVSLQLAGKAALSTPVSHKSIPPYAIQSSACGKSPADAPFDHAWTPAILQGLAHFWGAGVLLQALREENAQWSYDAEQLLLDQPRPEFLPVLIEAIHSDHPRIRKNALSAIGALGSRAKEAIPALIEVFYDPDPSGWTQHYAAEALGKIGPSVLPAVIEKLDDPNPQVRYSAVDTLELIGPAAAVALPQLLEMLAEARPTLRAAILRTLAAIGPQAAKATPDVILLLDDPEETTVFFALQALEKFGPQAKAAIPAIIERLERFSLTNQSSAYQALAAITGKNFGMDPAAWRDWWQSQK